MKKFLLALLVFAVAGFLVWKFVFDGKKNSADSGNKPQALVVSKHSEAFNASVQRMLNDYYELTEAFVQWDTAAVGKSILALRVSVDSLQLREMEKDSAVYPTALMQWEAVQSELTGLQSDSTLDEKKASLNMLSQQLFDLLRIVRYDVARIYFQECPMALNNYEMAGNWLSPVDSIRNPYLGTKDPKYGKEMLTCGSTKVTLDYTVKEPTKTE